MADAPTTHIGENSPEQVAFKLLEIIAKVERKVLHHASDENLDGRTIANRKWILDTYAECKQAVREFRPTR